MCPTTSTAVSSDRRSSPALRRKPRVYFSVTGKHAGRERHFVGRDALYKRVVPAKHQLRTPPGWAEDAAVLDDAERDGLTHAVFEERDSGRFWCARIAAFRTHGLPPFDRGDGLQVALPLCRWATGFNVGDTLDAADALVASSGTSRVTPAAADRLTAPRQTLSAPQVQLELFPASPA